MKTTRTVDLPQPVSPVHSTTRLAFSAFRKAFKKSDLAWAAGKTERASFKAPGGKGMAGGVWEGWTDQNGDFSRGLFRTMELVGLEVETVSFVGFGLVVDGSLESFGGFERDAVGVKSTLGSSSNACTNSFT